MRIKTLLLKWAAGLVLILSLLLAAVYFLVGYSPKYLYNAPAVATGIGAKLACSGYFVSGFTLEKTAADIEVYSPILAMLDYEFNETEKSVSASLLGIKTRTASYQEGIGCALDYAGIDVRASVNWPTMHAANAAWPRGDSVLTIRPLIQQRLDAMLAADNADGHDTRALLVAHKGQIVAESYVDGIDAQTPLLGWSMTKSVNALLVGMLEMRDRLSVNETTLYSHWADDDRADIRLEDLLHMTDGLDFDEEYDPGEPSTRMLFQEPDAGAYTAGRPLRFAPGTHFNYSSGTANLIADLVQQRITGGVQSDVNAIVNDFFRPLGMTSVAYEMDASGLFIGSSYLYASARDWAKIGQLMLNRGELNGTRFFTEDFYQRAVMPNGSDNKSDYGYQWWLNRGDDSPLWPSLPDSAFAAQGNREQRVLVLPDDELVIVRLGWSPKDYIDDQNFAEIRAWFQEAE
ncbi:serine hydrolase domain-containing protein [Reinekea blandensis]|uniref:Putative hydrolase transmembrane protein n=1 Tax=Reinekea blandensis MED297 TaxID=314283 RepID=A4BAC4_9GAMM|nr:serine hydrolase [Reinekea blandensis]EAR10880.1 putative hydrolase transmembrane protein [Reinekea sp. MED297] [Reinekea blandensis MED297]